MDVDTIDAGVDFVDVLQKAVQSCDVLVVLIGKQWLNVKDENEKRRLDNPEDFVRIEIATALNRNIRVIPVLVDGVQMPSSADLPDNLKTLARRNALPVNHHSFNADVNRLISQLEFALKAGIGDGLPRHKQRLNYRFLFLSALFVGTVFVVGLAIRKISDTFSSKNQISFNASVTSTNSFPVTSISTQIAPTATLPSPLGIDSTIISDKDSMKLLYVPAGKFSMGSDNGGGDEKPVHTVFLDAFWIDQTEVTNAMFAKFVDETGYITDAEKTRISYVYQDGSWKLVDGANWAHPFGVDSNTSKIPDYPVVHVSWNDANAYCLWVNRRLPTEAEWEKSASWDEKKEQKYAYPWGNNFNGALLNFCDKNCSFSRADQTSDDSYEYTSPVGSYLGGASPYGVYDLAGNISEWVADWYGEFYYSSSSSSSSNPLGPASGQYRVLRGGSWSNFYYDVRSEYRNALVPGDASNVVGFRCAMSASK
jgi:formylglycine-generating enzyme required for sulfatase activity